MCLSHKKKNLCSVIKQQAPNTSKPCQRFLSEKPTQPSDANLPQPRLRTQSEGAALFTKFHLIPLDNHLNNECWEMSLREPHDNGRRSVLLYLANTIFKRRKYFFLKGLWEGLLKTPANEVIDNRAEPCLISELSFT